MNLSRIASALIITAITVVFLIYAKDLLIPFVLAVFIWFIIREIRLFIRRSKLIREKIPTSIENLLSSIILFTLLGVLINILSSNINHLSENMPLYESNINKVGLLINETFKIDILKQLKDFSGGLKFSSIISDVLNSISSTIGNVFIILIYIR